MNLWGSVKRKGKTRKTTRHIRHHGHRTFMHFLSAGSSNFPRPFHPVSVFTIRVCRGRRAPNENIAEVRIRAWCHWGPLSAARSRSAPTSQKWQCGSKGRQIIATGYEAVHKVLAKSKNGERCERLQ